MIQQISIMEEVNKFLTDDSRNILNTIMEHTVMEFNYKIKDTRGDIYKRGYKLCKYIGKIFENKSIHLLKEENYKEFAEFINFCSKNKLIDYGVLCQPIAQQLTNKRVVLKFYVFSDFTEIAFNDIIRRTKKFDNWFSFYEGGLPIFEEVYKNINGLNQSIYETIYENGYDAGI